MMKYGMRKAPKKEETSFFIRVLYDDFIVNGEAVGLYTGILASYGLAWSTRTRSLSTLYLRFAFVLRPHNRNESPPPISEIRT